MSPSNTTGKKKIVCSLKAKAIASDAAERIGRSVSSRYSARIMKNTYTESHWLHSAPSVRTVGNASVTQSTGTPALSLPKRFAARIITSASA